MPSSFYILPYFSIPLLINLSLNPPFQYTHIPLPSYTSFPFVNPSFMLSKETRFVDLPQEIKQKLINIHKMSQQKYIRSTSNKLVNFNYLYSQTVDIQTNDLNENLMTLEKSFSALENVFRNIKRCINFEYVEEDLKKEIEKLKEEIETFKGIGKDLDFCGELEATYKTLERRYEEIKHKMK